MVVDMQGINLVVHAIKILYYDIWTTVRLTVLPFIIGNGLAFVSSYLLTGSASLAVSDGASDVSATPSASYILGLLLVLVITVFVFCLAAISWHRFVLLEEQNSGLLPKYAGAPLKLYIWAGVRLGLVSACLVLPVAMIAAVLMISVGLSSLVFSIIGYIVFIAFYMVVLRLSLILPGVAIVKPMSLGQSWNATKGQTGTLLVVSVTLVVLTIFAEKVLVFGNAGWIISFFLSWFSFALGISILTTFYGVYVEKREL